MIHSMETVAVLKLAPLIEVTIEPPVRPVPRG
jgi:hypothetical protein